MSVFLFFIGILGGGVSLVLIIVNLIKRKPKKKALIGLCVSVVLFLTGIITFQPDNNFKTESNDEISTKNIKDIEIKDTIIEEEFNIKDKAIAADFVKINTGEIKKDTYVHLEATVNVIFGTKMFDEISISTEDPDGYGVYNLKNYAIEEFTYNEGDLISIWGMYDGKDKYGIPIINGIVIEKADTAKLDIDKASVKDKKEEVKDIQKYREIITANLGSKDILENVVFDGNDIIIKVKLGDPAPFSDEDMAISRYSSITDSLLGKDHNLGDITVDFKEVGIITMNTDEKIKNEYGLSYFDVLTIEKRLKK